jgi:hypothetical protein
MERGKYNLDLTTSNVQLELQLIYNKVVDSHFSCPSFIIRDCNDLVLLETIDINEVFLFISNLNLENYSIHYLSSNQILLVIGDCYCGDDGQGGGDQNKGSGNHSGDLGCRFICLMPLTSMKSWLGFKIISNIIFS